MEAPRSLFRTRPHRAPLDGRTDLPHPAPGAPRPAPDHLNPALLVGGPRDGRTHDTGLLGDHVDLIRFPTPGGELVYRRTGLGRDGLPVFTFDPGPGGPSRPG